MKPVVILLFAAALALPFGPAARAQQGGVLTGTEGEHAAFFVQQATMSDMYEIEAAKIALQRTQSADVRSFAQTMESDHTRSKDQIARAVQDNNLSTPVPKRIDLRHQQLLDQLRHASDADFDRLYVKDQVAAHQEALKVYQHYQPTAQEAALKAAADAGLPMVQHHLEQAKSLQKGR